MSADDPIKQSHYDFIAAMKAGNVAALVDVLEDDTIFMPPADMTLRGKHAVRDWYEDYFKYFTILELDETERSVSVIGDCLVERIAVSVKLVPNIGGIPIYDDARILSIWRRQPTGSWKMWQSMWNSVKAIGAGTSRFLVRFMRPNE